jgi:peptide/nickel transport system ATP-binding protein
MSAIGSAEAPRSVATNTEPLLRVSGLGIGFTVGQNIWQATRDISFSLGSGERVGVVGESGCGKSITGLSLLGLLPRGAHVSGDIVFDGKNLRTLPPRQMRAIRGRDIAMIFQEPMSALDPVFTIGDQISEAWRTHFPSQRGEARDRTLAALADVGIPAPARRYDDYPHQLSGGMRQRVMIAMALICEPKLLVADEPTTALDVTVQAQIVDLLRALSERKGAALIFITHDLGVVAEICTRVLTMYAGEIVEDAAVDDLLIRPRHPYTSGLLRSLPGTAARRSRLPSIPGRVPSPANMPTGCRFRPRCPYSIEGCEAEQATVAPAPAHLARCWRSVELRLPGAVPG